MVIQTREDKTMIDTNAAQFDFRNPSLTTPRPNAAFTGTRERSC